MINITKDRLASMNIQYKYYPLKKFLDDAVDCGLSCVELWGAAPHFHFEDMTYRDIQRVRHEIETRNLKLVCYTPEQCVYPINMAAETEPERRRSLKFFEDSIRAASELGADKMLVTTGWGYFDNSNREEAWKHAREGIYDLAELGVHHGVKIALEVLRTDESNLVNNLPSLCKMLEELDHPNVGGMIDNAPMGFAGETPADYLKALGDKLIHVHFIDGTPGGHLAWGDGNFPCEQYLTELSEGGYKGYLSLEITAGRYIMDPTSSVKQSADYLFRYLK